LERRWFGTTLFGAALFEAMQAGADSEGFEAMRVGAERHKFGAALFGTALVWDYAVRSCVVRGYAGFGRRMQPGRAVIQPEFFFVA
jgi:hypothetical protein